MTQNNSRSDVLLPSLLTNVVDEDADCRGDDRKGDGDSVEETTETAVSNAEFLLHPHAINNVALFDQ